MAMRASHTRPAAPAASAANPVPRWVIWIVAELLLITVALTAQVFAESGQKARSFELYVNPSTGTATTKAPAGTVAGPADGLPSNSVIDLDAYPPYLWIATGGGLGRFEPVTAGPANPELADMGEWFLANDDDDFGNGGVSAVTAGLTPDGTPIVWAATAFDSTVSSGDDLPTGGGIGFSLDDGETWQWMAQPQDWLNDLADPTLTPVQNVTYDIALLDSAVWIVSWGGGVRRFTMDETLVGFDTFLDQRAAELEQELGPDPDRPYRELAMHERWANVPPDDQPFDVLGRNNHRGFSVASMTHPSIPDPGLLWVGTAGGINLSRDNGASWTNFRFDAGNDASPNGDFVPAMGAQVLDDGRHILWAGCWVVSAEAGQYYGASMTRDEGVTWRRVLGSADNPVRVHNFAFQDSVVYAATDDGLYKSADFGESWALFPNPIELETREEFFSDEVFAAAHAYNRLWVGGPEGLGISLTGGNDWAVERRTEPVLDDETYAYPNPFSPQRFPVVRLHYRMAEAGPVTVDVYDFALERLARPVDGEHRPAGEHDEIWDGYAPDGSVLANGVYFFRIEGGGEERWGKILLLD